MNNIFLPNLDKEDYETTSEYVSSEEKPKNNKSISIIKTVQPKNNNNIPIIKTAQSKMIINKRTLLLLKR